MVTSDKCIKVVHSDSGEVIISKDACHKMGISELAFSSEAGVFFTSSNDRSIKKWTLDTEAKTITESGIMTLADVDEQGYKENVDK